MTHKNNCLICSEELVYFDTPKVMICSLCGESNDSNVSCKNDHFICDSCHSMSANDFIFMYCKDSDYLNPLELADTIMQNSVIKMHGPEHHFLVPAVLLTVYYNLNNDNSTKLEKLRISRQRAEKVPGGFCGFCGNCGAGVGAGIFISLITDSTPLSNRAWQLANLMTGKSLVTIAEHGGPRCCKRDSFLAIIEGIEFLKEHFNIDLKRDDGFVCNYDHLNNECKKKSCPFYGKVDG